MKRLTSKYFIIISTLIIFNSCKEEETACSDGYVVQAIGFKLVDKTTNEDLFFSASPKYITNQLKLTYKKVDLPVEVNITSSNDKYLSFNAGSLKPGVDTVYLSIANGNSEPIIYNQVLNFSPCPVPHIISITYNGSTQAYVRGKNPNSL
jgi:hypothetical protein